MNARMVVFLALMLASCKPPTVQESTLAPTAQAVTPLPPSDTPTAPASPTPAASLAPTGTLEPGPPVIQHLGIGTVEIASIQMFDQLLGWGTGGQDGVLEHVLNTSDGGLTWHDQSPPEPAPASGQFKGVHAFFLDAMQGWVVYYPRSDFQVQEAAVWHTSDAGRYWTASQPLDLSELEGVFLPSDMQFVDELNGWLLAHVGAGMNHDYVVLFRSQDGGQSWQRLIDPYNDGGIQSCLKTAMLFLDAQNGWLTGDCNGVAPGVLLFRTQDGGRSWQRQSLPEPADSPELFANPEAACGTYDPAFRDATNGYLVVRCTRYDLDPQQPSYHLYHTTDGGLNWQVNTYPGGLPDFQSTLSGLALGASINRTDDGGATWVEIGNPGWEANFDLAAGHLWAVVEQAGTHLLYHSSDDGATWESIAPAIAGP